MSRCKFRFIYSPTNYLSCSCGHRAREIEPKEGLQRGVVGKKRVKRWTIVKIQKTVEFV